MARFKVDDKVLLRPLPTAEEAMLRHNGREACILYVPMVLQFPSDREARIYYFVSVDDVEVETPWREDWLQDLAEVRD